MTNQSEIDYEKQFQEDLAKATALSLESQALDEFKRSKKQYLYMDRTASTNTGLYRRASETEYNFQPRSRPGSSNALNSSSIAPPPPAPSRRYSEIRLPDENPNSRIENDLISFASPTSSKKPENSSFDRLIEDIQKLNTAPPPLSSTPSQHGFGSTSSFFNNQVVNQEGLQLVPFVPQQQKTPLTNEELQKLYSMPAHRMATPPPIGFIRPVQYGPVYSGQFPQTPPISTAYGYYTTPPNFGFHYNVQRPPQIISQQSYPPTQITSYTHQLTSTSETPIQSIVIPNQTLAPQNQSIQPQQSTLSITKSQSLSGFPSVTASSSMKSNSNNGFSRRPKKNLGDDLIDLNQEDSSRVSVLEAFDPLLNEDNGVLKN